MMATIGRESVGGVAAGSLVEGAFGVLTAGLAFAVGAEAALCPGGFGAGCLGPEPPHHRPTQKAKITPAAPKAHKARRRRGVRFLGFLRRVTVS